MVTTFNLFTSIAWIVAGIISAIISVLFLIKNPKKRLNQLFSSGFISWSLSLLFNGINFAVAYRSLAAANIFRDLGVATGILSAAILLISAIGIYFGAESLHWILYVVLGLISVTCIAIGVLNDWVIVDGFGGYKTTDNLLGKTFVQIIPAVFVITGAILLTITYFTLKNKAAKKRIGYFTIGFSTIILGLFMFLIDSFVSISPYLFPSLAIITWLAGPLLMLAGFYLKVETGSQMHSEQRTGLYKTETLDPKHKIEKPS
ncbi:MAG: hypothetical protein KAX09_07245 [Candidatus Heimdallarchaeota archaeon]|nr:hypothetical protein [Candidatus Heimdallarchaeota archaeon]MCK4290763.1 hypothetical protein [Candidatus Heimdallarchaeota archaeon]